MMVRTEKCCSPLYMCVNDWVMRLCRLSCPPTPLFMHFVTQCDCVLSCFSWCPFVTGLTHKTVFTLLLGTRQLHCTITAPSGSLIHFQCTDFASPSSHPRRHVGTFVNLGTNSPSTIRRYFAASFFPTVLSKYCLVFTSPKSPNHVDSFHLVRFYRIHFIL
jgi:hypothetical protein